MWKKPRGPVTLWITTSVFCPRRGFSVLDVERFDLPFAISLFRSRKYLFFFLLLFIFFLLRKSEHTGYFFTASKGQAVAQCF